MRVSDIPPAEQAARIRAALGYSGKEAEELADALGVSYATLRRRKTLVSPTGAKSMEELYDIADACGVPRQFMEEGFGHDERRDQSLEDRLAALEQGQERLTQTLEDRLAALEDDVANRVEQALQQATDSAPSTGRRQAT